MINLSEAMLSGYSDQCHSDQDLEEISLIESATCVTNCLAN
jgi:hypothetical protein